MVAECELAIYTSTLELFDVVLGWLLIVLGENNMVNVKRQTRNVQKISKC